MKTTRETKPAAMPPRTRQAAPPATRVKRGPGRMLTNSEKGVLCQLAKRAFDHHEPLGLTDGLDAITWRRREQKAACGKSSLRDCLRDDWRPIAGHFCNLLGWSRRAFLIWMSTGQVTDHGEPGDTHENREEIGVTITRMLTEHGRVVDQPATLEEAQRSAHARELGGALNYYYIERICRDKFRGRDMEDLNARELAQMRDTIKNRIATREGTGDKANRNKSQRKGGAK